MDTLSKANLYIENHLGEVKENLLPFYHARSILNWANDPNGFCYFNKEYHLFYQHYPYENKWGPMHWGHLKSKDLLHFENMPIALAPSGEKPMEWCFSGTAIEDPNEKGTLLIYYTSHTPLTPEAKEQTALAASHDGIHFEKQGIVIGTEQIPEGYSKSDFRDPKIYFENGIYYLLMAGNKAHRGSVLVYAGERRHHFEFRFSIELQSMGIQAECPDLLKFGKRYVLIYSAIHKDRPSTNSYAVLDLDLGKGHYRLINEGPMDYGSDFYAAQSVFDGHSHFLTAWLSSWKEKWECIETHQGWSGAFCLPRVLSLKDDELVQSPLPQFLNSLGHISEIQEVGALFFSLENNECLHLGDDDPNHEVSVVHKGNGIEITLISDFDRVTKNLPYEGGEIILAMDKCTLEFFAPSGKTATFFHHFGKGPIELKGANATFRPFIRK